MYSHIRVIADRTIVAEAARATALSLIISSMLSRERVSVLVGPGKRELAAVASLPGFGNLRGGSKLTDGQESDPLGSLLIEGDQVGLPSFLVILEESFGFLFHLCPLSDVFRVSLSLFPESLFVRLAFKCCSHFLHGLNLFTHRPDHLLVFQTAL